MNINDVFWKCKRVIRKNRETITRTISITLIVALIALVGYAAYSIYQADATRAALASQEEDKTAIKSKKPNYGEAGFHKVAENANLTLEADYTTGEICVTEKASGMKWYSNPQNRSEDKNVIMMSQLNSQIHVKFISIDKGVFVDFDNFGGSIKKGGMTHELIDNGIKFTFGFPTANVYIPVQYTLTEDGFQAEIVTGEIKGVGSNPYMVKEIALLPYFGAGGLDDEGYLLVPDGSGSLINYNNNKQTKQSYYMPVYGENPTLDKKEQGAVQQRASLPVFGAKTNDHAFLGVITSGEGSSAIAATTSKKDSSYNHVYASAILREYSMLYKEGNHISRVDSYTMDYSDDLMHGKNYAVRYFFLEGDQANYTGMSARYREYLQERNQLKDSELADKKYMVLDLVGAVSIKKYVVGVKRPVVTALTTYNDVCEIVKELKAQGVENLIINYVGALDSGLNNEIYNKVSHESVLGSKKEFKAMIEYLNSEGVLLFLESNPVDLYENGNGYTENGDSAKTFFDGYAFQYKYNLDLGTAIEDTRWHLMRPKLASEAAAAFADSAADWNVNQVSLARFGEILYSDYTEGENRITKTQVLDLWHQTLKTVSEKTKYLMLHGGNAYSAAYADVITDVSDSNSDFDMQDQSVPFYQLVFQGSTMLTGNAINTTVDYEYAFLKALETGSNLKFNLIYGDVSQLVGTDYNTMVSYSYDYWKNTVVDEYLAMQKAVSQFAGKEILHHAYLEEDVTLTKYESAEVIVNYGEDAYTYRGQEVAARSYLVLTGGAK